MDDILWWIEDHKLVAGFVALIALLLCIGLMFGFGRSPVRRYKIEAELETNGWWVWVQDREWVNDAWAMSTFLSLAMVKAMWKIRRQESYTTLRRKRMPEIAPPERWPQDATPPDR